MNRQKLSKQVIWVILITLVLAGCGASAAAPTPVPATATLPPIPEIEITYDGNECTVSGPTELPTGWHSFVIYDLSELDVALYVSRLTDGKTFKDLLDEQGEPGRYWLKPSWVIHASQPGVAWNKPDGGLVHTYNLTKEGEHAIYIGGYTPMSIWFCAPFQVIAAPSE